MKRRAACNPFSDWIAALANNVRVPDVELRWRICDAGGAAMAASDALNATRRCVEFASLAAWADICGHDEHPPREALRSGEGPRCGTHEGVRWAASVAHSARATAAIVGFIVHRSKEGDWLLFGIDIERKDRPLRSHVSRVICPRLDREAPPVRQGTISPLAVACIKEAVFKSDAAQAGRAIWDYDIVALHRAGVAGWEGTVRVVHEAGPRFHVAVHRVASYWVAMSVAIAPDGLVAHFEYCPRCVTSATR